MKLAKMGGYVDFTASPPSGCAAIMKEFMAEAPDGSVTMSSDSNGSMPVWNEKNELIGIKAAESTGVYETMVALHLEQGLPLEEASQALYCQCSQGTEPLSPQGLPEAGQRR